MPRSPAAILAAEVRRSRIADLYLRGHTQRQIGEIIGPDHAGVCRELKTIRAERRADRVADYDAKKAEELAKIDLLEREGWEAWERSKKDQERYTTEYSTTVGGRRTREVTQVAQRSGAAEYLKT